MYRKVNRQVETGAFMNYSKDSGNEFGMAARYCPHEDTTFTVSIQPVRKDASPSINTLNVGESEDRITD